MADRKGNLYLIPTSLGGGAIDAVLPSRVVEIIKNLQLFIAENEKTARHFIKDIAPEVEQSSLGFFTLNKRTLPRQLPEFLAPCIQGEDIGLLSEAGCPGVADPGAQVVALAHSKNIRVIPLVGPSSILLAMMASGLNGQSFAFNGYLPIDRNERKQAIKDLERRSYEGNQAQLFIETPYRNKKLLKDLIKYLHPHTKICVARELTLPTEKIITKTAKEWRSLSIDLHKKPALFILQKEKI